jgi:glycosyltransferase involved in cell wall biosynthesis
MRAMPSPTLRVLITCQELALRGGSQLYTRDLAEALRELGHSPVVFSPRLGDLSAELRTRGVAVIDNLDLLGEAPDVIHGQHHLEAMAAMLRFPQVPALYVCHGWLPWQEAPPRFPSLLQYVAVDALRRDRIVLESGIPESRVTVIPNFVDLDRFQPRPPLPERPRRALLLSNQASPHNFLPIVASACAASGIKLDVAGFASGNPVPRPEEILRDYDLVFARGRSAMEAMAVGAAVILCDVEGCGLRVDTANFASLRDLNFGMGALQTPITAERLRAEIDRYDPAEAARVRDIVRSESGRWEAVERLVGIYEELRSRAAELTGAAHERDCLEAASRYVSWLGPYGAQAAERVAVAEGRVAVAEGRMLAAAKSHATGLEGELAHAQKVLATLERSPFSRLRRRLLGIRPLVRAYLLFKGG